MKPYYCPKCQAEHLLEPAEAERLTACLACGEKFFPARSIPRAVLAAAQQSRAKPAASRFSWWRVLAIFGIIDGLYFWLAFDTTVEVGGTGRYVHNIGLMNQRTTGMIVAAAMVAIGLIMDSRRKT
jgi:hypothetical protein